MNINNRLQTLIALHFDPTWGARYWLERRAALDFNPLREIRHVHDLARLGPFPREELQRRPVEDFIPRKFHGRLSDFVTCETGGATGAPARTAFRDDEFHAAFVAPFLAAAELTNFPRNRNWLFIGPSGPHPIGKGARACARALGSVDPFMVDFDPRWVRRLSGFARERYTEHVLAQALEVLQTQYVGVLFATPPILEALGMRLALRHRETIVGVHLGGMAADALFWKQLRGEWFPRAVILGGYGNSLVGMCPQLNGGADEPPQYFPQGDRLLFNLQDGDPGSRGRLIVHRLDESCLLPNLLERDEAELMAPPDHALAAGFRSSGLLDPRPARQLAPVSAGLY